MHVLPWFKQRVQGRFSLHFVRDSLQGWHAAETRARFSLCRLSPGILCFE